MAEDKLKKSLDAAKIGGKSLAPKPSGLGNVAAKLNPLAHARAAKQVAAIEDVFSFDTAFHMAFLGAGQGGGRIADSFWKLGYRRVGIFNTTDSDFEGIAEEIPKLSFDIGGAAKDMEFARRNLEGRSDEIVDLMQRSWGGSFDCAMICVGLGGGSGSGSALPLVKLARKYMEGKGKPIRVGAVVALPSPDEGQQVARNAVIAFKELLAEKISPIIIIDNAKVQQLYQPGYSKLHPKSNELVTQLFHLFNQLGATKSPLITFDRSEFAQLMDGGIVVMGAADIHPEDIKTPADVSSKIREDLANSVLAQVDLRTGKKAACIFVASQEVLDTYALDFFAAGFNMLDNIVGSAAPDKDTVPTVIHRGVYPGADSGMQCYTMISELAPPLARLAELAKKAGLQNAGNSMAKYLGVDG